MAVGYSGGVKSTVFGAERHARHVYEAQGGTRHCSYGRLAYTTTNHCKSKSKRARSSYMTKNASLRPRVVPGIAAMVGSPT